MADRFNSFLRLVLILCVCITIVSCVSHKEKHYSYIQDVLNQQSGDLPPPFVVEAPPLWFRSTSNSTPDPYHYLRPTLILWDPISQCTLNNGIVKCPRCAGADIFLRTAHWKDGRNARNAPRLLFSQTGVTYLVSRVYRCSRGHEIVAHDESILDLFPCKQQLPFLLTHVSGITRDLYNTCILYSNSGLKIEQIESLIAQQHLEYFEGRRDLFEQEMKHFSRVSKEQFLTNTIQHFPVSMPDELKAPSNDFICQCIIHAHQENEMLYTQCMAQTSANSWISCDHTFKVAANIGLLRQSDKKWEKQYDSMFCILNEAGIVLTWQLTKGTAFDNVNDLFQNLKDRFDLQNKNVKLCMIDNCCAWRAKIQDIFGSDMLVKLDLFHAVQRTVKCIPKRHPFAYRCCQAFRLVFRDMSDTGDKRALPTPSPQVILENINNFLKTWKDISHGGQAVLRASALKEIEKLKKHVQKGCISYIPVGCGSERNENLHKCIRLAASKGRIGVLLAVSLLTSFLYKWNEKQAAKSKRLNTKVYPPITSRKNELLHTATLTKEQFGIGVSKTGGVWTLPASYENCCNSLSEMQDIMGRAFDDICETDESMDEGDEDEETTNLKDIESQAFTRALNLYYMTTNLPEVVNQAVNTDHFHLMGTHAVFSFGTMSSQNALNTDSKLENLLKSYKFGRVQTAADGDCLFSSIIFQLKQIVLSGNSDLVGHLQVIGFANLLQEDHKTAVAHLRGLMVSEMLENRLKYEGYVTNDSIEYEEQVKRFKQLGVYSGEIGNMMVLSLANVLRVNMVLFTSMDNFPVIPVTSLHNICTHQTLYLAFNHFGSGHYEPVVEVEDELHPEQHTTENCEKAIQDNLTSPNQEKSCGCGRGAAKKQKLQSESPKKFCYQKPGDRRTLCPCYRAYKACTSSCKCYNCFNTIGKRPDVNHNKGQVRRRERHDLQNTATNSLAFMQSKNEDPAAPKCTKLEHILIEVIVDILIERFGEATDKHVCKVFNDIVSVAQYTKEVSVPISNKSEIIISKKIKHITEHASLFRQFYLHQVEKNLFGN